MLHYILPADTRNIRAFVRWCDTWRDLFEIRSYANKYRELNINIMSNATMHRADTSMQKQYIYIYITAHICDGFHTMNCKHIISKATLP